MVVAAALLLVPGAVGHHSEGALAGGLDDDAGSGRDAPAALELALPVETGVAYGATLVPQADDWGAVLVDDLDAYRFHAEAGESIEVAFTSGACVWIYDAGGEQLAGACPNEGITGDPVTTVAPATGSYVVLVAGLGAYGDYHFGIGVGGPSPVLTPGLTDGAHGAARDGVWDGFDAGLEAIETASGVIVEGLELASAIIAEAFGLLAG